MFAPMKSFFAMMLMLVGCGGSAAPKAPPQPAQMPSAAAPVASDSQPEPSAPAQPNLRRVSVAAPGFDAQPRSVPEHEPPTVKLRVTRQVKNGITDEEVWLHAHPVALEVEAPVEAPAELDGVPRVRVFPPQSAPLVYYADESGRSLLWLRTEDGPMVLDLSSWGEPPADVDARMIAQELQWAARGPDGAIYVSHAHRTYAESSGGHNAYVTAIDPADGSVQWRSQPLVANARNFVIAEQVLLTGYGFTDEPDFVYALDARTGRVLAREPLRKGPSWLALEDGMLAVRTYDRDVSIELRIEPAATP